MKSNLINRQKLKLSIAKKYVFELVGKAMLKKLGIILNLLIPFKKYTHQQQRDNPFGYNNTLAPPPPLTYAFLYIIG